MTLEDIWKSISEQLKRAVNDRKHPFRLPVMGTFGTDAPNMRIVVLRKFQENPFTITAYTDIRSQKINEIQSNPKVTWLFWNARQQVQIRAFGTVQIEHQTTKTEEIWDNMYFGAKATYLAVASPSSPSLEPTNGLPSDFSEATAKEAASDNFCILHCIIHKVEWLRLNRLEHRRAEFILSKNGEWDGNWLIP